MKTLSIISCCLIAALVLLTVSCAPDPYSHDDFTVISNNAVDGRYVTIAHDNKRNVTCYFWQGVWCIKDSELYTKKDGK